jgi:hypothetical protein
VIVDGQNAAGGITDGDNGVLIESGFEIGNFSTRKPLPALGRLDFDQGSGLFRLQFADFGPHLHLLGDVEMGHQRSGLLTWESRYQAAEPTLFRRGMTRVFDAETFPFSIENRANSGSHFAGLFGAFPGSGLTERNVVQSFAVLVASETISNGKLAPGVVDQGDIAVSVERGKMGGHRIKSGFRRRHRPVGPKRRCSEKQRSAGGDYQQGANDRMQWTPRQHQRERSCCRNAPSDGPKCFDASQSLDELSAKL